MTKQELLDKTVELLRGTEFWLLLDTRKIVQAAWMTMLGYKPDKAMTLFDPERIAWLMDDRSGWLSTPRHCRWLFAWRS